MRNVDIETIELVFKNTYVDRETSHRGIVASHSRSVGDRPKLTEIRAKTGKWSVRRCLGGIVEQHNAGGYKDSQVR